MIRKTKKMLAAEAKIGQALETYIPEALTEFGPAHVARECGVSQPTLDYWTQKMGIRYVRVGLGPQDTMEIKRVR